MSAGKREFGHPFYDGSLPLVEKPSRYVDLELNLASRGFEEGELNVLLVFPDVYEIGMSNQGLRYLYHAAASVEGARVEMAFVPWPDLEGLMRRTGQPLRSWQTGTPARDFDLIGITLPYELHYTNVLTILDLAGIPFEASGRRGDEPVVIAGGTCVTNPLPVIGAFDAFFLGDGEEPLPEAVESLKKAKKDGTPRPERMRALAEIGGVYVDGVSSGVTGRVRRFGSGDIPRAPIVPSASIVHDRLSVEVMRGCTRGCRFCHAGMTYRPRRERTVDEIVEAAAAGLDATGWEEVSLLSLSTSDYSRLPELLERLAPELGRRHVSLALPSLRPETVTEAITRATARVRKSGFTIAPEAGTERLRRVINKDLSDEDILGGVSRILEAGWQSLKLYFMIGLPTETDEDLDGIVSLIGRIMSMRGTRGRFRLAVTISPFVPKPHTPFQWEDQIGLEEIERRERYLAQRVRNRKVDLSLREPRVSVLEGILARGGREVWPVVKDAWRRGCRFDSWRDRLDFDLWEKAVEEAGLTVESLLEGSDPGAALPWSAFDPGISTKFLLREREKALAGEPTPDCRVSGCTGCGACEGDPGKAAEAAEALSGAAAAPSPAPETSTGETGPIRYRFVYSKTGRARFISHRELVNIIQRALRRSGLPIRFSKGYHPHAKVTLGPALAVGMQGEAEFFDVELTRDGGVSFRALEGLLTPGMVPLASAGPFEKKEGRLPPEAVLDFEIDTFPVSLVLGALEDRAQESLFDEGDVWYRLGKEFFAGGETVWPGGERPSGDIAGWLEDRWSRIFASEEGLIDRKGRRRTLRGCSLASAPKPGTVGLRIEETGEPSPGPVDLLLAVLPRELASIAVITRKAVSYRQGGALLGPLDLITGNI